MIEIDLIGIFGIDIFSNDIKSQLKKANGSDLTVNIASIGGYTDEGIPIYNELRNYKRNNPNAKLTAKLVGYVASMASYVAMSPVFDSVIVEDNTPFMLHNSWTCACGDKNVMRDTANYLDGVDTPMVDLVSSKMKISKEEAQAILDKETWYFGQQIVDAGLADEVIKGDGLETDQSQVRMEIGKVQAKMKFESFGKYAEKIAASFPIQQTVKIESKKPKNQENKNDMDEQEKKENQDIGAKAEHARVKSIMALKEKYKETLKEKPEVLALVSDIIDKAIGNPEAQKGDVQTDIIMELSSGNVQAAIESPGATPQGSSSNASGEPTKTEEKGEDW